ADLKPTIPVSTLANSPSALIQLNDLTTGQTDLFPNQPLTGNSWTPPSNLTLGHTYRIWAKAFAPPLANTTGWWGPGMDFTINTSINPIDPATTLRPSLSWVSLAGVAKYEVWVQDAANAVNLTPGQIVSTNSWGASFDLISGHTYE